MPVDQKQAEVYVRDLLQKFDKDRESLDPTQRRLILKYREGQARAEKTLQELEQLRNQIKQAEARVRSLELQTADAQGRAGGYLDFLVSMKFEDEGSLEQGPFPPESRRPPQAAAPAGAETPRDVIKEGEAAKKHARPAKVENQQSA